MLLKNLTKPAIAFFMLSTAVSTTGFSPRANAQDDEGEKEVSAQGTASKSEKSGSSLRYLQLNLFKWRQDRGEVVSKTASTTKAPSKTTTYGFDQTDTLEIGVFGPSAFILAGVENPTDYNLAFGWRSSMIEAGLELGYANTETLTTTFPNGSELKTTTKSATSAYGILAAFVMADKDYRAKVKAHFGLTSGDGTVDNTQIKYKTSDTSGSYFGLGLEYAHRLSALGPKVALVHGLDYLYTKETDKNPTAGGAIDVGETVSTNHVWSFNLLGLRLHF